MIFTGATPEARDTAPQYYIMGFGGSRGNKKRAAASQCAGRERRRALRRCLLLHFCLLALARGHRALDELAIVLVALERPPADQRDDVAVVDGLLLEQQLGDLLDGLLLLAHKVERARVR